MTSRIEELEELEELAFNKGENLSIVDLQKAYKDIKESQLKEKQND